MLVSVCFALETLIPNLNFGCAHAGLDLAPMSIGCGLERFSALRHLDMQSVCGDGPLQFEVHSIHHGRLNLKLRRLALQPAAVKQLATLAGTLQTLRLVYHEDVASSVVRVQKACMAYLLLCLCTKFCLQAT